MFSVNNYIAYIFSTSGYTRCDNTSSAGCKWGLLDGSIVMKSAHFPTSSDPVCFMPITSAAPLVASVRAVSTGNAVASW